MQRVFQFRRGTSLQWAELNPTLRAGEPAVTTDTGIFKVGNGYTAWNDLPAYLNEADLVEAIQLIVDAGGAVPGLESHIQDPTPHPAYDDAPSLLLLYQNAKV